MTTPTLISESAFNPQTALAMEGLLTQGSGYLHIRGSLEEHLADAPQNVRRLRLPANVTAEKFTPSPVKWGTYVPGIFGNHPLLNREMINLPWFLSLAPSIQGERLDIQRSQVTEYRRELNLLTATLTRTLQWHTASGQCLGVRFERFISGAQPHLCVQRLTLTGAAGTPCDIEAGIDGDVVTSGHDHLTAVSVESSAPGELICQATTDSGDLVQIVSQLSAGSWDFVASPRRGFFTCGAGHSGGGRTGDREAHDSHDPPRSGPAGPDHGNDVRPIARSALCGVGGPVGDGRCGD